MPTNPPDPYADCLRPALTERVESRLLRGQLINVYGSEGQGIHRLVDDLKRHQPEYARVLRFNMKGFAHSYRDFLAAVADALHLPLTDDTDLRRLLNRALDQLPDKIWLCLEHFDRLADAKVDGRAVDGKGYDIGFLSFLNSLKNRAQVSLLICSARRIDTRDLHIGGKVVNGSQLDFTERLPLPNLTIPQVEAYWHRRVAQSTAPTLFANTAPAYYDRLITSLHAHPEPVPFLEYAANQPPDPAWTPERFDRHWRAWTKGYSTDTTLPLFTRLRRAVRGWRRS